MSIGNLQQTIIDFQAICSLLFMIAAGQFKLYWDSPKKLTDYGMETATIRIFRPGINIQYE
jgi:hypothetical protein